MTQTEPFGIQMYEPHKFPYEWTLKDAIFTKDKGKVFSCFSCGGGSTMGYKLAGFDVLGCNEIDPKMMACYIENHHPKYSYLESVETFKLRDDLPKELYNLDILDGSPPCSSFSMSGNREKNWGEEKNFREGQQKQILDELFFHYINLAEKLQPKVVIAENVKGLLLGNAVKYVHRIYKAFDKAGYICNHYLLDASKLGVPQRRERVFFVAYRKDLVLPKLNLLFNEKPITYGEIRCENGLLKTSKFQQLMIDHFKHGDRDFSDINLRVYNKLSGFNSGILYDNEVMTTIDSKSNKFRAFDNMHVTQREFMLASTFPLDYNFHNVTQHYITGMSVPPVMTAQIATRIYEQWLSKL